MAREPPGSLVLLTFVGLEDRSNARRTIPSECRAKRTPLPIAQPQWESVVHRVQDAERSRQC